MGVHLWDKDSKEVSKLTLSQMTQQIYEPSHSLHSLKELNAAQHSSFHLGRGFWTVDP